MKKVTLEYRRFWCTVKKTVLMPERWDELNPLQFIAAIRLWMGEVSEADFLRMWLHESRYATNGRIPTICPHP